jgi:hypothetical protein
MNKIMSEDSVTLSIFYWTNNPIWESKCRELFNKRGNPKREKFCIIINPIDELSLVIIGIVCDLTKDRTRVLETILNRESVKSDVDMIMGEKRLLKMRFKPLMN